MCSIMFHKNLKKNVCQSQFFYILLVTPNIAIKDPYSDYCLMHAELIYGIVCAKALKSSKNISLTNILTNVFG